ncbi:MAG: cobalamin biosynthesis protein [Deltaproteobacteria bacterium]|nr:cobalamin biosynthesis protein [Deltaproteobacteria bacterium]
MQGRNFKRLAAFAVTKHGERLALRLKKARKGLEIIGPKGLKNHEFLKKAGRAFSRCDGLIFICAVGIAVRAIAPHLSGKRLDPAVVALDEKGRYCISLLSGHLGGANSLAIEAASILGAEPVITTATDIHGLKCIEDIAERFGLEIDDIKKIKTINSALLSCGPVWIVDRDRKRLKKIRAFLSGSGIFRFAAGISGRSLAKAYAVISAREHVKLPKTVLSKAMLLRPKELVVGIGCGKGAAEKEVFSAIGTVLKQAGLSLKSIRNLATIDMKRCEKGLLMFAEKAGLKIDFFNAEELNRRALHKGSKIVQERTGAFAVAAPAAILSSGAKRLCIGKRRIGRVTVAIAKAPCS